MDDLKTIIQQLELDITQCLESLCERLQVTLVTVGTHRL